MAEIVGSLFGVTADDYERRLVAQDEARAIQMANLAPGARGAAMIQSGAARLGRSVGSMLGAQDPQLQIISARNQVMRQVNQNDPNSYMQVSQMLAQMGDAQGAMAMADAGRKAQAELALIGQRNAAAQASQAQAVATQQEKAPKPVVVGNALVDPVSGREIYKGPDAQKYSGFAQELIDAGLKPGTEPFQKRMLEYVSGKAKGVAKGTGNVTIGGITLDTGAASKKASEVVGTNVANIENQFSMLTAFDDAIKLVDQGIYGGAYGPEQAAATKYSLGLLGNKKKLENTEVFLANIGEIVIPRLQQFGGNDSNEELKYLQKVVAGDQRLEPAAVKRILASAEKKVRNNIARLQKQASTKPGEELPTGAVTAPAAPKATQRWNPQTRKLEPVTGN